MEEEHRRALVANLLYPHLDTGPWQPHEPFGGGDARCRP
jgi:hypothetical protein